MPANSRWDLIRGLKGQGEIILIPAIILFWDAKNFAHRTEEDNFICFCFLGFCNVCVCVGFVMCGCFGNMYTVL